MEDKRGRIGWGWKLKRGGEVRSSICERQNCHVPNYILILKNSIYPFRLNK